MQPISVALVDANNLFRQGLKALFTDEDFRITNEASSLQAAIQMMSESDAPQLVIVDPAGMGEVTEVVTALKSARPQGRVVLLTMGMDVGILGAAIQAGADGILMKDMSVDALAQSLRLVTMGEKVFPSQLAALLISGKVNGHADLGSTVPHKGLSQREVQIVRYLINGDSNKAIANHLNITEATIKVHLKSLLRKISASNRTQAAIWALNNGFGENANGLEENTKRNSAVA